MKNKLFRTRNLVLGTNKSSTLVDSIHTSSLEQKQFYFTVFLDVAQGGFLWCLGTKMV